mgnify:CR=1 FL=1
MIEFTTSLNLVTSLIHRIFYGNNYFLLKKLRTNRNVLSLLNDDDLRLIGDTQCMNIGNQNF